MLQVYLVRHGETEWNVARRIQGQSDSPLTAMGVRQAQQVAERVKSAGITHIISSDLRPDLSDGRDYCTSLSL